MIKDILYGQIGNIIWALLCVIVTNYKRIGLFIKSAIHWNEEIRFSIAYLYQIKIDNKYLLIKGNRIDQLQPVGGVYKYYSSFQEIAQNLEIHFENTTGFYEEGDLRFNVKGRYIPKVLNWFNSGKNREVTVFREFYEELIKIKIIPDDVFEDINIEYIKQVKPKMRYSKHFDKNEILIFNIFKISMSEIYTDMIRKYICNDDSLIKLVEYDDIKRECTLINGKSSKIGTHSKYVL